MLHQLSHFFYRKSQVKTLLTFGVLYFLFAIYLAFNPVAVNVSPFDLQFSYDENFAYQFLTEIGANGRKEYIQFLITVDFLYPLVYGTFLIVLLSYFKRNKKGISNLFPLLIILADYTENTSSILLTTSYPNFSPFLLQAGSLLTMLKWSLVGVCIGWALFLIGKRLRS